MDDGDTFARIDSAFRAGDLDALRSAVDDPDLIPNGAMPRTVGHCLEYAIYHSPLSFIRELLELGADPNPEDHDGFPPLIAALSNSMRSDTMAVLELLLSHGADPNQRGLNDYTPLHVAVAERHPRALELLLSAGADPHLRTRIDDFEAPLDLARGDDFRVVAELIRSHISGGRRLNG